MKKPEVLKRFSADVRKKEFIPVKILHFLLYGGTTVLFPFLTIQARSLGITETELGIVYSLLPVVGICIPPISGMIADKIGNFKVFMSICCLCSGLAGLLYLAIPPSRITHVLPAKLLIDISCAKDPPQINVIQPFTCDIKEGPSESILLNRCVYHCPLDSLDRNVHTTRESDECIDGSCSYTTDNPNDLESAVKQIVPEFKGDNGTSPLNLDMEHMLGSVKYNNITKFSMNPEFCSNVEEELEKQSYWNAEQTSSTNRTGCWIQCISLLNTTKFCNNTKSVQVFSPAITIVSYSIIRVLNSLTLATSFPLIEGATIAIMKEHDGDLGFQRLFANLGMIVLAPISGKLIDVFSKMSGTEDFSPAFYLYCFVKCTCAVTIIFIDLDFKQPSSNVFKDFRVLVRQPEVASFLSAVLVGGVSFGFVETFLFWLLQDMDADKSMMGMTITVGAVFGIPILFYSTAIIKKFGHVNTICFSLVVFMTRLIGYSFIGNPWYAMPFEALECVTVSLFTVTAMSYAAVLSTPSTVVSLQGIYGGLYHGVGRGVGSLLGGFLIHSFGIRNSFRAFAASCAVASIIYLILNYTFFRKWEKKRDEEDGGNEKAIKEKESAHKQCNVENNTKRNGVINRSNGAIKEKSMSEKPAAHTNGAESISNGVTNEAFTNDKSEVSTNGVNKYSLKEN